MTATAPAAWANKTLSSKVQTPLEIRAIHTTVSVVPVVELVAELVVELVKGAGVVEGAEVVGKTGFGGVEKGVQPSASVGTKRRPRI